MEAVWQLLAAVGILLYPIGIPAFVIYSLWKHHSFLYHDKEQLQDDLEQLHIQRDCYALVIENYEGTLPHSIIDIYADVDLEVHAKEAELEAVCAFLCFLIWDS